MIFPCYVYTSEGALIRTEIRKGNETIIVSPGGKIKDRFWVHFDEQMNPSVKQKDETEKKLKDLHGGFIRHDLCLTCGVEYLRIHGNHKYCGVCAAARDQAARKKAQDKFKRKQEGNATQSHQTKKAD